MSESGSVFDKVQKFFAESPWQTSKFPGQTVIRFSYEGEHGSWVCIAHAREAEERFVFYSIGIAEMPLEKRLSVAEFITRANFGLIIGNFEMDLDDGEVRFKTSIDVEGDRLSSPLIRQLVYVNLQMMDKYLPGFQAMLTSDITAEAAVALVEGPPSKREISLN